MDIAAARSRLIEFGHQVAHCRQTCVHRGTHDQTIGARFSGNAQSSRATSLFEQTQHQACQVSRGGMLDRNDFDFAHLRCVEYGNQAADAAHIFGVIGDYQ